MKPEGVETRTLSVDGMRINVYEAGQNGSPVVLLHGGGTDSAMVSWSEIAPGLAKAHRVIIPDLPGYGQSDKPNLAYTQPFYLDFLEKFLNTLGLEKVSLAGLSLGGGISLGYALACPQRVDKLVLVDSYGIMPINPYHRLIWFYIHTPLNEFSYWYLRHNLGLIAVSLKSLIYDPRNITPELVEELKGIIQDPSAGKAFMSFQRSEMTWTGLKSEYTSRFGEITQPTLILQGDQDTIVPLRWAKAAQAAIPGARLVVLKNRKHWSLRDNPAEIVDILLDFFAG